MIAIVAELGINHQGNLEIAKELATIAKNAGATHVKLQKKTPEFIPAHMKNVSKVPPWASYDGDPIPYIEYIRKMQFGLEQYQEFKDHCSSIGIKWFASVWDSQALKFIAYLSPSFVKIPSAKVNDLEFIKEVAKSGFPVVMSTGMSTSEEVDEAAKILRGYADKEVYLLHCHSAYPAPDEELNLSVMINLKETCRIGIPCKAKVGFSSHSVSPFPAIYAAAWGADMLEVHLTKDRSWPGSDHAASLEPAGLELLVREIKRLDIIKGDGLRRVWESEKESMKRLRDIA